MQTPDQDLRESERAQPSDPVRDLQDRWSQLILMCRDKVEPVDFDGSPDQQRIEAIKRLPEVDSVVGAYRSGLLQLDSLELAAIEDYGDELPRPVTEAHLLFCHRNALTDFVGAFARACDSNDAIADGMAQYRDNPALPDPCLLAISDHQYRLLYTAFAFGWVRDEPHPDLNQVFRLRGMEYLGKIACASGAPNTASEDQSPPKVWREIRKRSPLADLFAAAASDNKASLAADLIQYLFIAYQAAAAGALDPADAKDNALARTASVIIGELIDELSQTEVYRG